MNMATIPVIQSLAAAFDLPLNCTFDADDWMKLARHWYPIALSREVVDGPIAAKLLDALLVVYRIDGQVVVANDLCPIAARLLVWADTTARVLPAPITDFASVPMGAAT